MPSVVFSAQVALMLAASTLARPQWWGQYSPQDVVTATDALTNVVMTTVWATETVGYGAPTSSAEQFTQAPAPAQTAAKKLHKNKKQQHQQQNKFVSTFTSEAEPAPPTTFIQQTSTPMETPMASPSPISSPSPSPMPSSSANTGSSGADSSMVQQVLNSTNSWRQKYNAQPVVWDDKLAQFGQNWVEQCTFQHTGGPYGENLALGYSTPTAAVDAWGNEESEYNWAAPGFTETTGHFTQLVWKATTSVGCGWINCQGTGGGAQGWYLACEYNPPGNVATEYAQNVVQ